MKGFYHQIQQELKQNTFSYNNDLTTDTLMKFMYKLSGGYFRPKFNYKPAKLRSWELKDSKYDRKQFIERHKTKRTLPVVGNRHWKKKSVK